MRLKPTFILLGILTSVVVYAQSNKTNAAKAIVSGVTWYDQDNKPVSAHGANIIYDGGRYYMFGEYKTDSANVFTGFSCYSSDNLTDWKFESIAFSRQQDGRMGPNRVGERPKVLKCPKTGEYIMLMHTDNLAYKDPCTCYATSKSVSGPYVFQGPILYKGEPVKKWDIGSFVDDDGLAYLLVHHGGIYRLSPDFHSLDSCMMSGLKGAGESPAMMKKDGVYYWMSSHTTSWERNDNMYWTSKSLSGPWEYKGEFCPKGTLTWNSQCSFILPLNNGTYLYMGDRWSFPRQRSAATYVWQPLTVKDGIVGIPEYYEAWNPETGKKVGIEGRSIGKRWASSTVGDCFTISFKGERVAVLGNTDENSGYADVTIRNRKGREVFAGTVDFYSKALSSGIRFISPALPKGKYTMEVRVADMKPNWTDKKRILYGSKGYKVEITDVVCME
ncbi:MAG: family 43 glycosylhydrolase [Prevotella sp.]|nr:family 43 glycosylhydrolase [Prevotella sp.]